MNIQNLTLSTLVTSRKRLFAAEMNRKLPYEKSKRKIECCSAKKINENSSELIYATSKHVKSNMKDKNTI